MLDSGGGAIVNMASVAGVRAMTNLAAYVAAKAAIIGLTEVAALDYADRGVRVNVVAPGRSSPTTSNGPAPRPNASPASPCRWAASAPPARSPTSCCGCAPTSRRSSPAPPCPIDGGQFAGNKPPQMYRQGEGMAPTRTPTATSTTDRQGARP